MKRLKRVLAALAVIAGLGVCTSVQAEGIYSTASAASITAPMPVNAPAADRSATGDQVCTSCHDENDNKPILAAYRGKHGVKADGRTPGCQTCHGASVLHAKNGPAAGSTKRPAPDVSFGKNVKTSAAAQNATCTTCHQGGKRTHWAGSAHESRDVTCVSCHVNHTKQDKVLKKATQNEVCFTCHQSVRAETHRMSTHPLDAGTMSCSDCHNAHGSTGPKLLIKQTTNETCFTCHAEKRGPFLFEHSPVAEDCTNCHVAHGSTNAPLLKARSPWLCQQCHQNTGAAGHWGYFDGANLPGGAANVGANVANPTSRIAYRGCVNCHSQIHGSNSPTGGRFVR